MSVPTETEFQVEVPPPPTKTEAVLVPPKNARKFPTAIGDGGVRLYHYELTKAVGNEGRLLPEDEVARSIPLPRITTDTITQSNVIPWNRIIVEDIIK